MDFSRTRFSLSRPLTDYTKVQNVIGAVLRCRSLQGPRALRKRRYLNAGCGPNIREDFINLDYDWRPGVDLCWDLRKPIAIPDASLEGVYSEHCLEHLAYDDAVAALKEFRRLLKPGKVARIVVPDAGMYMDLYHRHACGESVRFPYVSEPTPPGFTPLASINRVFRSHGHQYAYDAATLGEALKIAGFRNPSPQRFMVGADSNLLIDSEERSIESLYMEAVV